LVFKKIYWYKYSCENVKFSSVWKKFFFPVENASIQAISMLGALKKEMRVLREISDKKVFEGAFLSWLEVKLKLN